MVTPPETQTPNRVVVQKPDGEVVKSRPSPIDEAPGLADFPTQAQAEARQPKWSFTIPVSARSKVEGRDPSTVTLRELTPDQIELASRLAMRGTDGTSRKKSTEEQVKMSLWEVDGRRVNHGEAEADAYWGKWSPKVRVLVTQGWARIHLSSDEEDAAFLGSMTPV